MVKARKLTSGGSAGEVDLNPAVFEYEPKKYQVHECIKSYLRNQRQGTHSTKTRSEVAGGGAKPWRQKGTGRARAGTNNSPLWIGGGVIFGPRPRNYHRNIPRRLKRQALKSLLADKAQNQKIVVFEELQLEKPRTKSVIEFMVNHDLYGHKVLILNDKVNKNFELSCRNIPGIEYRPARLLNSYDLMNAEYLLLTESALTAVEEVFGK